MVDKIFEKYKNMYAHRSMSENSSEDESSNISDEQKKITKEEKNRIEQEDYIRMFVSTIAKDLCISVLHEIESDNNVGYKIEINKNHNG